MLLLKVSSFVLVLCLVDLHHCFTVINVALEGFQFCLGAMFGGSPSLFHCY